MILSFFKKYLNYYFILSIPFTCMSPKKSASFVMIYWKAYISGQNDKPDKHFAKMYFRFVNIFSNLDLFDV